MILMYCKRCWTLYQKHEPLRREDFQCTMPAIEVSGRASGRACSWWLNSASDLSWEAVEAAVKLGGPQAGEEMLRAYDRDPLRGRRLPQILGEPQG